MIYAKLDLSTPRGLSAYYALVRSGWMVSTIHSPRFITLARMNYAQK